MGNVSDQYQTCTQFLNRTKQGAKAAQKRERNTEKAAKGSKSQAKVNEAAKSIVCLTCKQPFVRIHRNIKF